MKKLFFISLFVILCQLFAVRSSGQCSICTKTTQQMGEKPADVALAWLLTNPVVTAPIIGPRTLEQLTGALRALKVKFTKTEMKELDKIWPGPGGEAPEAYAW